MDKKDLVLVGRSAGQANAEMLKMVLESFGIQVFIYGESVGSAYGLTITPLGEVELWVPKSQSEEAAQILNDISADSDSGIDVDD
jgi:hypothetical protein